MRARGIAGATLLLCGIASARLVGIPTTSFVPDNGQSFSMKDLSTVIIDPDFADERDNDGLTQIPPSLREFGQTFAEDLSQLLKRPITTTSTVEDAQGLSITLTIGERDDYLDAAGRPTSEGYTMEVNSSSVIITGASPLGAWWATRSFIQQAIIHGGEVPSGSGSDSPGWSTRGAMLDTARKYYPPDFVIELCSWMSFYKQNILQFAISNNIPFSSENFTREEQLDIPGRFRLWSDEELVKGLNVYPDESYTREQFDEIQQQCAQRGVTILPEINTPGHSLVITQWHPELGLEHDLSLLNLSKPESTQTVKDIWTVFLPWFHTKEVHIGADEYRGDASDYTSFVNDLAEHIDSLSGKTIRIWSTFLPNATNGYPLDSISVQHWAHWEVNPNIGFVEQNYSVINSDDWVYTVGKYSGYPQVLDPARAFNITSGGPWAPWILNSGNSSDNPAPSNQLIRGQIIPQWNDWGETSVVPAESYYTWRSGLPAFADKQWGGDLSQQEFVTISETLLSGAPAQNLDRAITTKDDVIFDYNFIDKRQSWSGPPMRIIDTSSNDYHATTSCEFAKDGTLVVRDSCSLKTPFSSKGRNYDFALSLQLSHLSAKGAVLAAGSDSTLVITPEHKLGLKVGLTTYTALDLDAAAVTGRWMDIDLSSRRNQTFIRLNRGEWSEITTTFYHYQELENITGPLQINAPIQEIGAISGSWEGSLRSVRLVA